MPGMVIDGIAASEAIDSSGEILDIKGCDISDLENGVGVLNYEHRGDDANGASAMDVVGKITFAKKIFDKSDCDDERQRSYWDFVKLPFIYIRARLYDADERHGGARAAAAMIRDHHDNSEPILARFSIEGSTIKKEGRRLLQSIARKVALTLKPCNKSAISGLVSDPNGPTPLTEKKTTGQLPSILDSLLEAAKSEGTPGETRLGGYEVEFNPMVEDDIKKTTTGSVGDVAPSTLTGGAALVREDLGWRAEREKLKNQMKAALRDYDPVMHKNIDEFVKSYIGDQKVSPEFLNHFKGVVEHVAIKRGVIQKKDVQIDYTPAKQNENPLVSTGRLGMDEQGKLKHNSPKAGKLQFFDPSNDPEYNQILHADNPNHTPSMPSEERDNYLRYVHHPWQRAMSGWLALNKLAREKKLPESIIAHSALFAAMSPNTSVPLQELYYGHLKDFIHKHRVDVAAPWTDEMADAFNAHLRSGQLPEFQRDFYEGQRDRKGGINPEEPLLVEGEEPTASFADRPQGAPVLKYHELHPFLVALHNKMGADARSMADYLMQAKAAKGEKAAALPRATGYGPKLIRYLLAMMGGGNVIVPDRHMMRSLFDVRLDDMGNDDYLTGLVRKPQNERILRALDQHFFQKHPTVKKVLNAFPDHFKDDPEQSIFPSFWLNWLIHPAWEAKKGYPSKALSAGTDHHPYFASVHQIMNELGIPHDVPNPGEPWKKSEVDSSGHLIERVAKAMQIIETRFGHQAALFFYYSYGVPALLSFERANAPVKKSIKTLGRLADQLTALVKDEKVPQTEASPLTATFDGKQVMPGIARLLRENDEKLPEQKKYAVLGVHNRHHVVVPFDKVHNYKFEDIEKWHPADEGYNYSIDSLPGEAKQQMLVDSAQHGVPEFLLHPDQHSLIHGMDLGEESQDPTHLPGIYRGSSGHRWLPMREGKSLGIVKERVRYDGVTQMPSTVHAEGLYHNLAKHFFGMGDFVPTTSIFRHPKNPNQILSAQEMVKNARHVNMADSGDRDVLKQHLENGEMDKMVLMDRILGNSDRHNYNYVIGTNPKGKEQMYLIDHGHTMSYEGSAALAHPHYYIDAAGDKLDREETDSLHSIPIHAETAAWLLKLDPRKLRQMMEAHHAPQAVRARAVDYLVKLQEYVKENPKATLTELAHSVDRSPEYVSARRRREANEAQSRIPRVA